MIKEYEADLEFAENKLVTAQAVRMVLLYRKEIDIMENCKLQEIAWRMWIT